MPEFLSETAPHAGAAARAASLPWQPLDLLAGAPALSREEAALSRLLGRGLRVALPDPALEWLLLPAAAGHPDAAADKGQALWLDSGAGPLFLDDGARFIAGLTGIDGNDYQDAWPQWMVGAVAGRLAATPLAGLAGVRPAGRMPAPPAPSVRLTWRLSDGQHALITGASASPATWNALLHGAATRPLRMPWSAWLPLALDWPVLLAAQRLPLALYRTLAIGDVILPDSARFDVAGRGRVTLGGRRWQAAFVAPCRLQLLNEEDLLHTDPNDEPAGDDGAEPYYDERGENAAEGGDTPAGAGAPSGAVSLTLRFELGRARLSLDELRALAPHSVLELADGSPHAIAIVCGGTEVGRGEAVDVDGRLGVRITHWSGAC